MQEGYKSQWLRIVKSAPEVLEGSSNKYQNWELFDPEKWVPDGYVLVRVDSRGAGRSPGYLEVWSPREAKDIALCVDWAGVQPWSNGKVGLHGISYYSMNQWQAAPLKPKHLAALCIWEGSSDYYRELCRHGGILSRLLFELVSAPGHRRAKRRRRQGRKERRHRRAGRRPRHAVRGATEEEPRRLRRRRAAPSPDRRLLQGAAAEIRGHRDAAVLLRQLGRHGPASARQFRRLSARGLQAEVARGARRHPLHAVLREVRPGPADASSSTVSSRASTTAGTSSRRCCSTSAIPARSSCSAPRTNGRSRARNGPSSICIPTASWT